MEWANVHKLVFGAPAQCESGSTLSIQIAAAARHIKVADHVPCKTSIPGYQYLE